MNSAIYSGNLAHNRYQPQAHHFSYPVMMILLDLEELDSFFARSRLWAAERSGLVSFRRKDYLPDSCETIRDSVVRTVAEQTGLVPDGPVYMLTNLRYWGLQFNPASFYYCFDQSGLALSHILIEVHNTPWGERHRYVLAVEDVGQDLFRFKKAFHVSPFYPMEMTYSCKFSFPAEQISVQMENHMDGERYFKAFLSLKREDSSPEAMSRFARNAWKLPLRIIGGIYWQAARLFFKRVPFYSHP